MSSTQLYRGGIHLSRPMLKIKAYRELYLKCLQKGIKKNLNPLGTHTSPRSFSNTAKNAVQPFNPRKHRKYTTTTPSPITNPGVLSGKTAIITGGSRGIGLGIAQKFAAEGASCILVGRNDVTLKTATDTLTSSSSKTKGVEKEQTHSFQCGDISSRAFWVDFGKNSQVKESCILVNAAGITHSSLLVSTSPQYIEEIVETNLMGIIWSCQIISKLFLRKKEGCIINISSLLGTKGGTGSTVYAASKAGVIGLTRSLAAEIGPIGVRVNVILPGYIETSMTDEMDKKARAKALESIPLGRFGTTAEVADAALFLATNKYATNCVLNLDGGLSAT